MAADSSQLSSRVGVTGIPYRMSGTFKLFPATAFTECLTPRASAKSRDGCSVRLAGTEASAFRPATSVGKGGPTACLPHVTFATKRDFAGALACQPPPLLGDGLIPASLELVLDLS